jgi:hypothetical protein
MGTTRGSRKSKLEKRGTYTQATEFTEKRDPREQLGMTVPPGRVTQDPGTGSVPGATFDMD